LQGVWLYHAHRSRQPETLVFPFQAAYSMERRRLIAKTHLTLFGLPLYAGFLIKYFFTMEVQK